MELDAHADKCAICEVALEAPYLDKLDTFTTLCEDHGLVHRKAYGFYTEEEFAEKYKTDDGTQVSVDIAQKVIAGVVMTLAKPTDVARKDLISMKAHATYGAWNRSEFFVRYGYMPEQLFIKPWNIHDQFNEDFCGVLTNETEGAPRLMTISSERVREKSEFSMLASSTIRADQAQEAWEHERSVFVSAVKEHGSKIMSVSEIESRVAKKVSDQLIDPESGGGASAAPRRCVPGSVRGGLALPGSFNAPASASVGDGRVVPLTADSLNQHDQQQPGGAPVRIPASSPAKTISCSPARAPAPSQVNKRFPLFGSPPSGVAAAVKREVSPNAETPLGKAAHVEDAVSECDLEAFYDRYPDDPDKAKWEFQKVVKLNPVHGLTGKKLGRERNTALLYSEEADKSKRRHEGDSLRERSRLSLVAETIGQNGMLTMPRKDYDAAMIDLKAQKVDFPTKTKQECLNRVVSLML